MSIILFQLVTCEFKSKHKHYFRTPFMLNKWPPIRQTSYRNSGLRVQLRPAGSNNIISRVPSPAYFNSDLTLRSRFNNFPMKSILYQSNVSKNGQLKLISSRPNAYALKENRPKVKFNYITRPTKPVNINNFDATLAVLKPNEYIYEKFNMQVYLFYFFLVPIIITSKIT